MESVKDKIEKLLNLSMSDNEHEASLALQKALKLMNEHNLTKDDIYRQSFISEVVTFDVYRLPSWMVDLYSSMANVSGCHFVFGNGSKRHKVFARGKMVGRERDVKNAVYLVSYLYREVLKAESVYKKKVSCLYVGTSLTEKIKSFKKGFINGAFLKIYDAQNQFFNDNKSNGLICMELETKLKETLDFLHSQQKTRDFASKSKVDNEALLQGARKGNELEMNQAVNKGKILQIGVTNGI
jgi:hypothetical protein